MEDGCWGKVELQKGIGLKCTCMFFFVGVVLYMLFCTVDIH
jgi:hypothetical protein